MGAKRGTLGVALAIAIGLMVVAPTSPVDGVPPLTFAGVAEADDPDCAAIDPQTGEVVVHPENCAP